MIHVDLFLRFLQSIYYLVDLAEQLANRKKMKESLILAIEVWCSIHVRKGQF